MALSCVLSQSPLQFPQNTIIRTTLLQFHSNSDLFDVTQRISPKPTNEFSVRIDHATVIKNGSIQQLHVSNYFLNLYVKSTNLTFAHQLFDEMPERDVRSWTILISGFSRNGSYKLALDLFSRMQKESITPNQFTFSAVFKCCASANELNKGKTILGWILRNGVCLDTTLENSVLDFYVKCEAFDYARKFFELMSVKDTVSWNIMISGYLKNGDMEKAEGFFRRLPIKNAASWNTIIDGYLQNGCPQIALQLLYEMVTKGPSFTHVTFSIALILVSSLHQVELGKQIHGQLLRVGIHDPFIKNSLLDMYCKCGEIEKASIVFKTDQSHGESLAKSVSLSSMINGYIQNDKIEEGLKVFSFMINTQGEIDKFTLATVLSACADSGLLELGQLIHTYILKTGHQPDVFIKMGRWVSEKLFELEPLAAGPYVLMSKTCASDFRWEEAAMLKAVMQEKGIKKQPGQSWIH
ncbi:hypothetical protein L6452_08546 [Arctium lappa]|uniref:Uncharacterized protein n=1 Tax=Arctium lappa TaxID=4217 RepID=A0ACB9DHJ0_ARCLA|nr:hypothetical protein L6452_08546 [Arctium lappa]